MAKSGLSEENLINKAKELMKIEGPVRVGTDRADFMPHQLTNPPASVLNGNKDVFMVLYHMGEEMGTLVIQDKGHDTSEFFMHVGLYGRENRRKDAHELVTVATSADAGLCCLQL